MSISSLFILIQFALIGLFQFAIAFQHELKSEFKFDSIYNPVLKGEIFAKHKSNFSSGHGQFEMGEDACKQLPDWELPIVSIVNSVYYFDNASVSILRKFLLRNEHTLKVTHLHMIRRYINEWDSYLEDKSMNEEDWKFGSDPTLLRLGISETVGYMDLLFRLTYRVLKVLPRILEYTHDELWTKSVVQMVYEAEAISGFTSDINELEKMAKDMMQVADTYELSVKNLFVLRPTAEDLVDEYMILATAAFDQGFVNISRDLLRTAKELDQVNRKVVNLHRHAAIDHQTIKELYFNNFDKFVDKLQLGKFENLTERPSKEESKFKDLYIDIFINTTFNIIVDEEGVKEMSIYRTINLPEEDEENFKKLCQGVELRTAKELSQLFCRLDNRGSKWLMIMPAKVEMLSNDPEVIIFHDVLTNKQRETMQQKQLGILTVAQVQNIDEEHQKAHRMSFLGWLQDSIAEEIMQSTYKIEELTGLSTTYRSAESLQVNVYRAGGRFLPHMDSHGGYFDNSETNDKTANDNLHLNGDRMATFMFYLNDDYIGGRTVFTRLGVSVAPIRGTAIYWKSLLPSIKGDTRSYHAGCPVLAGLKWVANKWILSNGQMFRHKCNLKP